jgi:hypothetical protein
MKLTQNRTNRPFPFFLILIGSYPVLFLYAANLDQISFYSIIKSLLISNVASIAIIGVCLLITQSRAKTYLATILLYIAFFSYGHLFNLIDGQYINQFLLGRHMFFFPIFTTAIAALLLIILLHPLKFSEPTIVRTSNWLFLGLFLFQGIKITTYQFSSHAQSQLPEISAKETNQNYQVNQLPDIYYIIVDGLVREDIMKTEYGYSGYTFPDELRKREFYIPECAFSNYKGTATSMASALNLDYLDALGVPDDQVNNNLNDPPILYALLQQNQVVNLLKEHGYQFISFRGFFPMNDFKNADIYYNILENRQGIDELAERSFREMFIRTTLLRLPVELYEGLPGKFPFIPRFLIELIVPEAGVFSSRSYQWFEQHHYTFDTLETIPSISGPKFIYAHLYTTHQPFVLREDGSLLWPVNENNDGYIASVKYTSQRLLQIIDRILASSPQKPIIIIQADHGTGTELNRYKILNAYYFPGAKQQVLYSTITPVNTFRIIFKEYLGENFDLLPDKILVSTSESVDFIPTNVDCDLK